MRSSCLFAPSTSRVRSSQRMPTAATFRPQVFSTSRRLTPQNALRVCFAPLARAGFSPSGSFPPREPHRLSTAVALLTFPGYPPPTEASDQYPARLQGLAPPESPSLIGQVLPWADGPIPSWGFPSTGFSLSQPWILLPGPSPLELFRAPYETENDCPSGSQRTGSPAGLSRDCRPS